MIPSVNLSERYDSNVYYGPPGQLPPGRQSWDLVTTTGANVQIENKSRLGDSVLNAGVSGSAFAYNTELAFVSTSVFAASDLTGWASELVRGLGLRVSNSFQYTPEPPAFLTGVKPGETSDIFSRGIQGVRANTFKNVFTAQSGYSIYRSLGIRADYSYSVFRVGNLRLTTIEGSPVRYFDTTQHSVTTGPTYSFGGGDTLFAKYIYAAGETVPEEGGNSLSYVTHTLTPEYVTKAIPGWTLTINGGVTLVEQLGNRAFFSGKFALATNFDVRTRVQVQVSRQAAPAFFGSGGAMISNVAQISVNHGLSKVLRMTVSANYAHNTAVPVETFRVETITAFANLEYKLTRSSSLVLMQEYNRFDYTGVPQFDRYATTLTFNTVWK